jgi:hypothetical protein
MARGVALTAHQVHAAITHNLSHQTTYATALATLQERLGLARGSPINETFVRAVADWQEDHIRAGAGDGKIDPKTEAYLNIQHPKATAAAARALAIQRAGGILFDSWGKDVRDNNNDGVADDRREQAEDGEHYAGTYPSFSVVAGTYTGLGWGRNKALVVPRSVTVSGPFMYRVCAAVVSRAYHEAGVMPETNRVANILEQFRPKGYVWKWSEGYPSEFLPGDLICTLAGGAGHAGIVVTRAPTTSSPVPTVVELPGPSTQVDLGTYDPVSRNDVRLGTWTKAGVDQHHQYLGRLLLSKLR